jgi:hypothetical protein
MKKASKGAYLSDSDNERGAGFVTENKNTTTDTIDDEKRSLTKPIIIKHAHRLKSASVIIY